MQEFAFADLARTEGSSDRTQLDPRAAIRNDLGNIERPRLKKTPGGAMQLDTITRSGTVDDEVRCQVINGISPKKTSSSLMSRIDFTFVSGSLS